MDQYKIPLSQRTINYEDDDGKMVTVHRDLHASNEMVSMVLTKMCDFENQMVYYLDLKEKLSCISKCLDLDDDENEEDIQYTAKQCMSPNLEKYLEFADIFFDIVDKNEQIYQHKRTNQRYVLRYLIRKSGSGYLYQASKYFLKLGEKDREKKVKNIITDLKKEQQIHMR